ncbi:BLUF domain-containing protein [Rubrivirga sp.]|uniref:BLUF domain-containing protein n=1 Tax=Rubrivirga sp. TaxID=1885344 RepID=UPI003B518E77
MVTRLVYASSAVGALSPDDLLQIVRTSRRNNAAVGVTGALLYHDGNVMQVLEGPAEAVDGVFARVGADKRHRGVLTLLRETADERAFPEWSMGLLRPDDVSADGVGPLFEVAAPGPERARRLLHSFRALVGR